MKSQLSRRALIGAAAGSTIAATEAQAGVDPLKSGVNIAGLEFTGYAAARPASPRDARPSLTRIGPGAA